MSLLTRTAPPTARTPGTTPLRSPFLLGMLAGAQAAVGSLLCVLVPTVLVWMASTTTDAAWTEAARVGAGAWLLAHHAGITVGGAQVTLVPLGLTVLAAAWTWSTGSRLGMALTTAGPTRLRRHGLRAWAAFVGAYSVVVGATGLLAGSSVARPVTAQAIVFGLVLSGALGGIALLRSVLAVRGAGRTAPRAIADALRLPSLARAVLRAAAASVAVWVAAGALLTALVLAAAADRVGAVREALAPGVLAGAGVTVAELAYLPTAVLWSASWLAGPGFAVGTGTSVAPGAAVLGPLPALPVLGALPEPGVMPSWLWTAVAVPVLAGAVGGWSLRRSRIGSRLHEVGAAVAVAVTAGVGATVLAWLSTGAIAGGRMSELGPTPGWVGLAVAGEVLAGAVAAVLLLPRLRGSTAGGSTAGSAPLATLKHWRTAARERVRAVPAQLSRVGKKVSSMRRW